MPAITVSPLHKKYNDLRPPSLSVICLGMYTALSNPIFKYAKLAGVAKSTFKRSGGIPNSIVAPSISAGVFTISTNASIFGGVGLNEITLHPLGLPPFVLSDVSMFLVFFG